MGDSVLLAPLAVPLFRQAKDSTFCGICCMQMVYHYHGYRPTLGQLIAGLDLIPNGVYAQQLALHLARNGFTVTLATRDTTRLPLRYSQLTRPELRAQCEERLRAVPEGHKEGSYWRGMLGLLDAGARLDFQIPTLDATLGAALAAGHPPIVCVDAKTLYDLHGQSDGPVDELSIGQAGHYLVVIGLDHWQVTVNDPSATFGGVASYPRDRFLYAWYSYQAYTIIAEPARDSL